MAVVNYKCPNCTAGLRFDGTSGKMVCDFCESSFTTEELEALYAGEMKQEEEQETWTGFQPEEWQTQDMQGLKIFQCPSCGAEIIADDNTGAMKCPYCDNPTIVPKQFEGVFKPDYVLPFKLDKKAAVDALKKLYKGKKFLPNAFTEENHIQELTGMYVPFWLFDAKVYGDYIFDGTHTRHRSDKNYNITEVSHFRVRRAGEVTFSRVPVDGSSAIDDTMMESIEPFNYSDLTEFQYSYLAGYVANKYDVEPDALTKRVYERIRDTTELEIEKSAAGYETLRKVNENVRIDRSSKVHYALLPVWFLNTTWNGKRYTFVMNGQTGKLCGDLPTDNSKFIGYLLKTTIAAAVPLTAVLTYFSIF